MHRTVGLAIAAACILVSGGTTRADDKDVKAILDKAITALGGEEKLGKIQAFSWKSKGVVVINGEERESSGELTAKGLDQSRREFGTDQFHGVFVLSGDKGWRKFGDQTGEIEGDFLTALKRGNYMQVVSTTLVPLRGKGFKAETAGEEKVGDKPASILKITGPDGKDYKLSFDKESGLPVKEAARVMGFQGQEHDQVTTFADYKDFGGIKKATKIEVKRDGEKFSTMEISEFKVLDKVDPETFAELK
jgi:hypothetical protein